MSVQPISPIAVVSRVWQLYTEHFAVLIGTAVCVYTLQFVIFLILPEPRGGRSRSCSGR